MVSDLAAVAAELEAEGRHLVAKGRRLCELAERLREHEPEPHCEPTRLLRAKEAAELLGVAVKRFYSLASEPNGPPCVRLGEKTLRWPLRALEEWIREQERGY